MTQFSVIIPARLASSRLPEKLLSTIGGKSVLQHSYLAAKKSQASRVIIAADNQRLIDLAHAFGAEAVLTRTDHESGTDRLAQCVEMLSLPDQEIIVNLQGDEPFMPPDLIDLCAKTLSQSIARGDDVSVSTLAARINNQDDIDNPNVVKVVINRLGQALYFSRAPIPFNRDGVRLDMGQHYFHHLGIYGYRAGFLKQYRQLNHSALESIEKLEQLRILDHGGNIVVAIVDNKPPKGIDTMADLIEARKYYARAFAV
ncbi:MAG: 3-deoxy-manno-octulosonate cytidylyltransferase [Gammaproteobacteria bacterium]|nr:MAG: 3-deoxy-manno-octulosonate cytidylyltransferase [Gammaproteobacteria bacterium]